MAYDLTAIFEKYQDYDWALRRGGIRSHIDHVVITIEVLKELRAIREALVEDVSDERHAPRD